MKNLKRAVDIERINQKLTAADVVNKSEMTPNTYYTALKSNAVTLRTVTKIAKALGLSASELIKKAEDLA